MKYFYTTLLAAGLLLTGAGIVEAGATEVNEPLRGEVISSATGEPVPGATVLLKSSDRGTAADSDGRFELRNLEAGNYTLLVRAVGFVEQEVQVAIPADEELRIELQPDIIRGDDVIVTTSPVGRNIQYQPAQGYNIQQLQERQASSFGEMLDGEAGIAMRSFGPAPARPVIRGFDGDRLLILENGERMGDISNTAADHNIALDPLAADRVEVVRGPASLLYGSSALGGIVNIFTSDIPREWDTGSTGSVALEGASVNDALSGFGRYQYGGNNWASTARLSYRNAGNLSTPEGTLPGTSINNLEGSGGFSYRADGFTGGLSLSALDHTFGLPEEIDDPDEEVEIRMNQQTMQGRAEWSQDRFINRVDLRFHGSRLFQQEVEMEFEDDGSVDEDIELEFEQYALNSTLSLRHQPIGLFDEGIFGFNFYLLGRDVGGDEAFTPGIDSQTFALFTYQEIPLSPIATLQFGVRGETKSMSTRTNDDFPDIDESKSNSALSGSVGLNLRPFNGVEIGAQLARAHRFPILEELYADGVHFGAGVFERGDPGLNTESSLGTDLFFRYENRNLRAELAGFYYGISDFVAFEPTGEIFTDDSNREWDVFEYRARDARLIGGEAQLTVLLTDALQVGGIVDYVRGSRVDTSAPLPTMPPLRFRVNARYDTGSWWIGSTVRFVSEQSRVVDDELPTDGYTLINANAGYNFTANGSHRISLKAENLSNITYRDHLSRIDRSEFGFPMPGRNISLSYRVMF